MTEKAAVGHFGDAALDKLHENIPDTTEGGACLTGHESEFSDFKEKRSCNYRYQAYEQAEAQVTVKEQDTVESKNTIKERLHLYKKRLPAGLRKTSAYRTKKGGQAPYYYCAEIPFPNDGDWDVGGPMQDIVRAKFDGTRVTIKATMNFTQDTWPYWNNAHHLIPKGTLKSSIAKEGEQVSNLIQKKLLEAKYNINYKINMLLMPQDREVAELLDLPRHLQLKEGDGQVAVACTDHPVYSNMVLELENGLNKIIQKYKEICDQNNQGAHKNPNAVLDKKKLEHLSEHLLELILGWGSTKEAGKSLDDFAEKEKGNYCSSPPPKTIKV